MTSTYAENKQNKQIISSLKTIYANTENNTVF
jgi:hypothetical protein